MNPFLTHLEPLLARARRRSLIVLALVLAVLIGVCIGLHILQVQQVAEAAVGSLFGLAFQVRAVRA